MSFSSLALLVILWQPVVSLDLRKFTDLEISRHEIWKENAEELYHSFNFTLIDLIQSLDANNSQISAECGADLWKIQLAIYHMVTGQQDDFILDMMSLIDAGGKPGAGLLQFNLHFEGYKGECEAVEHYFHERERPLKGQFLKLELSYLDANRTGRCANPQQNFLWDMCLPESCSRRDLTIAFGSRNWNYQSYITLFYMTFLTGLVVIASVLDVTLSSESKEVGGAYFISSFSIFQNVSELLAVKKNKAGQINQLHGIRFLSMCWIIMGHSMSTSMLLSANLKDALEYIKKWTVMIPALSYYAVDTFFFQSGFLLAFLWFKGYDRNPKAATSVSSWVMFYVHRFFRLSPAYYIVIAFYTFVYSQSDLLVKSPLFLGTPATTLSSCPTQWHYNLLYVNNLVGVKNACYLISWYLATDMQLYIAAPVLILPYILSKPIGFFVSLLLLIGGTVFNFITVYLHRLPPYNFDYGWQDPESDWSRVAYETWMYNPPWMRAQPYIIGFILGYFMHDKLRIRLNKFSVFLGWFLIPVCVFAVSYPIRDWVAQQPMALLPRALYSALARYAWSYMIGWIVFSCYYGYGGPVNRFLNWPGWVPLGKLSYCAYLVHLFVVVHYLLLFHHKMVFLGLTQTFLLFTLPIITATYLLAIFWSAIFEIPIAKVEAYCIKLALRRPRNHPVAPPEEPQPARNGSVRHPPNGSVIHPSRTGSVPARNGSIIHPQSPKHSIRLNDKPTSSLIEQDPRKSVSGFDENKASFIASAPDVSEEETEGSSIRF
ncbi:unnamed protein product [Bursaphelenchus xylophilus]|uniref:(pine wood nematode) hypothetical protein n=1 Tax=Bursaphelenchus xylophilus TaxID=6326 RepID=A0A7I8X4X5_BURXY|nr:unnamed protein product [Bursaphelenchus xylophilus]CAG9122490.1 unnamed protein product [Bursaphelenchus xylophilus]